MDIYLIVDDTFFNAKLHLSKEMRFRTRGDGDMRKLGFLYDPVQRLSFKVQQDNISIQKLFFKFNLN